MQMDANKALENAISELSFDRFKHARDEVLHALELLDQMIEWSQIIKSYYMDRTISIPTLGKLYLFTSIVLSTIIFSKSVDPYNLSFTFKQTIF